MSQSHLAACASCGRHVRVSESTCPFCRSALTDAFRATPARQASRVRLARAALFALGTGVPLTAACSSKSSEPTLQPMYGGAAFVDASIETETDGPADDAFEYKPTGGDGSLDAADASPYDSGDEGTSDAASDANADADASLVDVMPDAADGVPPDAF
jgi:hypothetical protein